MLLGEVLMTWLVELNDSTLGEICSTGNLGLLSFDGVVLK
jgi:hypothetical protein